ncbi:uncharacterized protein LOC123539317 [Mercenaria mercenaria]|uniref:uncharacterized protein LOC123539317 n=1 Tax=Mercenaria mercenaria TaxID=6596 RepID=UPI001E1D59AC|nr:uncharacterized protein LOC123539317 [Mercenaria mercenaria]
MIYTIHMFILALCSFAQLSVCDLSTASPIQISDAAINKTLSKKLLSRRRGLIPKSRRRGDTYSQLLQTANSKKLWNQIIQKHKLATEKRSLADIPSTRRTSTRNNNQDSQKFPTHGRKNDSWSQSNAGAKSSLRRRRRWDYDENYDWENGGKDYVIPGDEPRKETKFEKFAKSWQKHALKVIFLFSFVCMLCCCCLAICKKFCSKVCETVCWHLRDYREMCLNRDPSYRKARKFADDYGIELDYDMYTKIKKNYEEGFQRGGHDEYRDLSGR